MLGLTTLAIAQESQGVVQADASVSAVSILAQLEEQVRETPDDASLWRLIGKARQEQGDFDGALAALKQAITLDRLSAAAYFDLGQLAQEMGDHAYAQLALQQVQDLAPDSEYATKAAAHLAALQAYGEIMQTDYSIRSFDGSNLDGLTTEDPENLLAGWADDFEIRLDLGAQYNSNVSLAPSSRELSPNQSNGAQANLSAQGRWLIINGEAFRFGPTLDMDFTFNEGNLEQFNLQSYRPGVMADGTLELGEIKLRPRVSYNFDHDEFQGDTFGNQHSITTALGSVWTDMHTTTAYYSIGYNNLANDGDDPFVTSQDGWSNTVGMLHDRIDRRSWFRLFRVGGDFQDVDADGADFRFRGGGLFTQVILVPVKDWHVTLRGGWVYRDYYDFTDTPSRDTHIWKAAAEVRKYFAAGFSTAFLAQYDNFQSQNSRFDSDRFLTGGVVTWEY